MKLIRTKSKPTIQNFIIDTITGEIKTIDMLYKDRLYIERHNKDDYTEYNYKNNPYEKIATGYRYIRDKLYVNIFDENNPTDISMYITKIKDNMFKIEDLILIGSRYTKESNEIEPYMNLIHIEKLIIDLNTFQVAGRIFVTYIHKTDDNKYFMGTNGILIIDYSQNLMIKHLGDTGVDHIIQTGVCIALKIISKIIEKLLIKNNDEVIHISDNFKLVIDENNNYKLIINSFDNKPKLYLHKSIDIDKINKEHNNIFVNVSDVISNLKDKCIESFIKYISENINDSTDEIRDIIDKYRNKEYLDKIIKDIFNDVYLLNTNTNGIAIFYIKSRNILIGVDINNTPILNIDKQFLKLFKFISTHYILKDMILSVLNKYNIIDTFIKESDLCNLDNHFLNSNSFSYTNKKYNGGSDIRIYSHQQYNVDEIVGKFTKYIDENETDSNIRYSFEIIKYVLNLTKGPCRTVEK